MYYTLLRAIHIFYALVLSHLVYCHIIACKELVMNLYVHYLQDIDVFMLLVLLMVHGCSSFKLSYIYVVTMSSTLFESLWQAYFHSISFHFRLFISLSMFKYCFVVYLFHTVYHSHWECIVNVQCMHLHVYSYFVGKVSVLYHYEICSEICALIGDLRFSGRQS